ncbi:AN1-type zinc finger protein 2B [Dirofilaria immitis]
MAEFPGFGRHCNFDGCNLLDFLPIQCDACKKDFCGSHFSYDAHCCQSSYKTDTQVPVCPLCSKPIPVTRGERPDKRVGDHIDSNCKSNPAIALKGKIYTYHCSQRNCKKRELVSIKCGQCGRNFCLRHRFPTDHNCMKMENERVLSNAALAALRRNKRSYPNASVMNESDSTSSLPDNSVSEDEALTRALQEMLNNSDDYITLEERDRAIAEKMQRMEYQQQCQRVPTNSNHERCAIS